jgi:hypothetical protein
MEDHQPRGSRFLIELPVVELPAAATTEHIGADTDR